jgi:hypothetical protein
MANRPGLTLDVGEEGGVAIPLQPLPDEGPEDDLKAHGQLEGGGRPSRYDPSPVQDVLRENEENALFVLEHPHLHSHLLPSGRRSPLDRAPYALSRS